MTFFDLYKRTTNNIVLKFDFVFQVIWLTFLLSFHDSLLLSHPIVLYAHQLSHFKRIAAIFLRSSIVKIFSNIVFFSIWALKVNLLFF